MKTGPVSQLIRWGVDGYRLQPDYVGILNAAPTRILQVLEVSIVSGYSTAANHDGSHKEGWAADFGFHRGGWNRAVAHMVKDYLYLHGVAVAFRIGTNLYSTGNHMHTAVVPFSNSETILLHNKENPWHNNQLIEQLFDR